MRNFLEVRRYLTGGIDYNPPIGRTSGSGVTFTGANNGVSISSITPGTVVLGQDVGQAGAPGQLISNREIPLNGFSLAISQIGSAAGVALVLRTSTNTNTLPQIRFVNNTGILSQSLRVDVTNTSYYLGSTNSQTALGNFGLGGGALNSSTTGPNIAIGNSALTALVGGQFNVCIGISSGSVATSQNSLTAVGANALATNGGAAIGGSCAFGSSALQNLSTGNDCVAVGRGAGQNLSIANDVTIVGTTSLSGNAVVGDFSIVVGAISINLNNAFGASNIVIGSQVSNSTAVGASNIFIGSNITIAGAAITNTSIIYAGGTGANSIALSNVFVLGNNTQNVLVGQNSAAFADNGNRLQVSGKLNTGGVAPLTLGAGACDFGNVVTAASVLNATKYWEVSVGGVLLKVCIN
jgi:hypothetical protein